MKRASTSLPVPDSPAISTVQSLAATRRARSREAARGVGEGDHVVIGPTDGCRELRCCAAGVRDDHQVIRRSAICLSRFSVRRQERAISVPDRAAKTCRGKPAEPVTRRGSDALNRDMRRQDPAARRQTSDAAASLSISNLRSFSTSVVRRSFSNRAACATVPPARFSAC